MGSFLATGDEDDSALAGCKDFRTKGCPRQRAKPVQAEGQTEALNCKAPSHRITDPEGQPVRCEQLGRVDISSSHLQRRGTPCACLCFAYLVGPSCKSVVLPGTKKGVLRAPSWTKKTFHLGPSHDLATRLLMSTTRFSRETARPAALTTCAKATIATA